MPTANLPEITYDCLTGRPLQVASGLSRKLNKFKRNNWRMKVGITGRDPIERFREHCQEKRWQHMVLIYESSSGDYVNRLENHLIEKHWDDLENRKPGGGSYTAGGRQFLYVLLR